MKHSVLLTLTSLLLLSGCGSDDKGRPNVQAPVNNIQDNIEYKQATEEQLRAIGKKKKDETNKEIDAILNKSKPKE